MVVAISEIVTNGIALRAIKNASIKNLEISDGLGFKLYKCQTR